MTDLSIGRVSGRSVLLKGGIEVLYMSWKEAEVAFADWLETKCEQPRVLPAHNCFTFNAKVILRLASPRLCNLVRGFAGS